MILQTDHQYYWQISIRIGSGHRLTQHKSFGFGMIWQKMTRSLSVPDGSVSTGGGIFCIVSWLVNVRGPYLGCLPTVHDGLSRAASSRHSTRACAPCCQINGGDTCCIWNPGLPPVVFFYRTQMLTIDPGMKFRGLSLVF